MTEEQWKTGQKGLTKQDKGGYFTAQGDKPCPVFFFLFFFVVVPAVHPYFAVCPCLADALQAKHSWCPEVILRICNVRDNLSNLRRGKLT